MSGRLLFPRSFNPECKPLVEKLLLREIQNRLGEWREGGRETETAEVEDKRWMDERSIGIKSVGRECVWR